MRTIAIALRIASRSAWARGSSPLSGVSSTSGATIRVGSMPACRSNARRLGLALARISGGDEKAATGVALFYLKR